MHGYFEGWYYKLVDKSEQTIMAMIPGVSFDKEGGSHHCFVQFLDNSGTTSRYFHYDIEQFSFSQEKAEVRIGDSFFSPTMMELNIKDDLYSIQGTLYFHDLKPWPITLFSPGAMGKYAFVPLLECYHGVLSFDHLIEGQLKLNGKVIDFSGGRGYTEKDWGKSFPSYHIWMQTNHFDRVGISLMVSVANVPWLGKSFNGLLAGLWCEGNLYRLTTYTGAKITAFYNDQERLALYIESKKYHLEVEVPYQKGVELRVPVIGDMKDRLSESLTAQTKVRLYKLTRGNSFLLYHGIGRHTGLEIEGRIPNQFL
jgi:hypothetical protein